MQDDSANHLWPYGMWLYQVDSAEQQLIAAHLPADAAAAALLKALQRWHLGVLQRDQPDALAQLYPLLRRFLALTAAQQQQISRHFAFSYALQARSEQQQLADALCQAVLWQHNLPFCRSLQTAGSAVRLQALRCGWWLRNQLPWQQAVPALLNNVCDKIFDVELSLALAWWLLIQANQDPLPYMQAFAPSQHLLWPQYHERLTELMPGVAEHVAELVRVAGQGFS